MGDEYVRGNHDAHITCARIARAALTAPSTSSPSSSEREALEDSILPCPFCGELPAMFRPDRAYQLSCVGAECNFSPKTGTCERKQDVIDLWNQRAALSASHVRDTGTEEVRRETIRDCKHEIDRLRCIPINTSHDRWEALTEAYNAIRALSPDTNATSAEGGGR
jgi:hypothetical protein